MKPDGNFSEPSDTKWKSFDDYFEKEFGTGITSDCLEGPTELTEVNPGSKNGDIPSTFTTLKPLELGEKMSNENSKVYLTIEDNFDEHKSSGAQIKINEKCDSFFINQDFSKNETPETRFNYQTEKQSNLANSYNGYEDKLEAETTNHSDNTTPMPDEVFLSNESNAFSKSNVDDVLRSCLSNVQYLDGMSFSLSNTKTNNKEFIKIEWLIPRKSFKEHVQGTNKRIKDDDEKLTVSLPQNISGNQLNNSASYCSDRYTNSKPRQNGYKNLPSTEELKAYAMEKTSLNINLPEKKGSIKRKLDKVELESVCGACGDKATKFTHYGGRSCQSCRAFFRRTVEKFNVNPWMVNLGCSCNERCKENEQLLCNNNTEDRKKCKYCRFQKCQLLAGMERKWVLSGNSPRI